ncbi:MAG: 2-C-methyl-D-erythritol 2,4-cyclodiphosphate synthase [Clostridia bacterium]|nr:2-C-methyl-D-erythritol 2,4-cyclodiphosphate synthase [Clostridia bacterium]
MTPYRIGHGYDVHRLVPGRRLVLGGVEIPHERGLLGHSDADVLLHAIMDAVLGALAAGDIGKLFPDKDPAYSGIDSRELVRRVAALMHGHGYAVGNIDATVLAESPKLSPHIERMRLTVARLFGCPPEDVSIKATTEEGLGFTGRAEGIAAHAVVLLTKQ